MKLDIEYDVEVVKLQVMATLTMKCLVLLVMIIIISSSNDCFCSNKYRSLEASSQNTELFNQWSVVDNTINSTDEYRSVFNGLSSSAFVQSLNDSGLWIIGGLYLNPSTNLIELSNTVYYFDYQLLQLNYIGSLQWAPIGTQSYQFYCKHECAVNINDQYIAIVNPSVQYNNDINIAMQSNVE